jgi:hypothetical protein
LSKVNGPDILKEERFQKFILLTFREDYASKVNPFLSYFQKVNALKFSRILRDKKLMLSVGS